VAAVDVEIDDDKGRVDLDVVWSFLSTEAYWARWRDRATVEGQIRTAWRVVGAYRGGEMIGFARATSDGYSVAILSDVFVVPAARRLGVGKALVAAMVDEGPGASFQWILNTSDAHSLYAQFGFAPPDERCLVRPSRTLTR
jgi:GNAT superfamily N-acetyltransferase